MPDSDAFSPQFYIKPHLLYPFLRGYELPGHPTDQHQDGILIHTDSSFRIPTQDLIGFLMNDAITEQPSSAGGNDNPAGQNGSQNGTSYSATLLVPAVEFYLFLQSCTDPACELPSSDSGDVIPSEQNGMPPVAPLLLIPGERLSPFLQTYEIAAAILYPCPICERHFRRWQERDRHLESYLPHSIYCPDCNWTGRRQWDFKEHWKRKHKDAGRVPGEDENEIYNTNDYVKSILEGTPVDDVARSAFAEAQERLGKLKKTEMGANVLGRNRDLKGWVHTA